jgi:hypothetical protein
MRMPSLTVHDLAVPWTVNGTGVVCRSVPGSRPGAAAIRVEVEADASGAATLTPAAPMDLSALTELRFRTRTDRAFDGSPARPFHLELGYDDAGDQPAESHHWLVAGRPGRWESHRLGIAADRRSAITRFRIRTVAGRPERPVRLDLEEFLAVADDPVADAEAALVRLLTDRAGPVVTHEPPTPPAIWPTPPDAPDPAILLGLVDLLAEPRRGQSLPQRDSFRRREERVVCSVRPPAVALTLAYHASVVGSDRAAALRLLAVATATLCTATSVRTGGVDLPLDCLPAPSDPAQPSLRPLVIRIGTRQETSDRVEASVIRTAAATAGLLDGLGTPDDSEGIVLRL